MFKKIKQKAFTLAETITVLVIMGTLITIIIPTTIKYHRQSINRVKIKKSMAYYESVFKKLAVDNNIMSDSAFLRKLQPEGTDDKRECTTIKKQFKIVETDAEDNCIFRSSEDVWWNISDFTQPFVAIKKEDLNNNDKKLYFSGHIENGVLRINDVGYLKGDEKTKIEKTYNYINNKNN